MFSPEGVAFPRFGDDLRLSYRFEEHRKDFPYVAEAFFCGRSG
jgi:hypothetical protein